MKKFKNQRGLSIHSKSCKGERAEEAKIKGLEPMFLKWEVRDGKKMSVKEKKCWRDAIRVWLLKRVKCELNLGLSAENPQNVSLEDDSHIHETLVLVTKSHLFPWGIIWFSFVHSSNYHFLVILFPTNLKGLLLSTVACHEGPIDCLYCKIRIWN